MFIGRRKELQQLHSIVSEKGRKLIATIGRRGNGKTSLHNYFKQKLEGKIIEFSGQKGVSEKKQVKNCSIVLRNKLLEFNWLNFFLQLEEDVLYYSTQHKKVFIFIDEFAWLHTKQSDFIEHFGTFWNRLTHLDNLYCFVTSSAVSWMDKNVLKNKGGLYHKVNLLIKLKSFSLEETKEYLTIIKNIKDKKEILDYYLLTGGVPRYLDRINGNFLFEQNAYNIFYSPISSEFEELFDSIFSTDNLHSKAVMLFKNKNFLTIQEASVILNKTSKTIESVFEDLVASDILSKEENIKPKERNIRYYLSDLFCFNYIKTEKLSVDYFKQHRFSIRNGYNLELAIQNNIDFICKNISRNGFDVSTYKLYLDDKAQIDLIINYGSNQYSLLEIKNKNKIYIIDKEEYHKLVNRVEQFQKYLLKNKIKQPKIDLIIISFYGSKQTENYNIDFINYIDFPLIEFL